MEHETRRASGSDDIGRNIGLIDIKDRLRRQPNRRPDQHQNRPVSMFDSFENINRRQRLYLPPGGERTQVTHNAITRRRPKLSHQMRLQQLLSNSSGSIQLSVVTQQVQEKTSQATKKVSSALQKGWRKGREGLVDAKNKAIPAVKTTFRQLSNSSITSVDAAECNENHIQVVQACPISFHPAFMHGDKLCSVPGIHPPSYEDALRHPTEPPGYTKPPPMPPRPHTHPTKATDSSPIYDVICHDHAKRENKYVLRKNVTSHDQTVSFPVRPPLPPRNKTSNDEIDTPITAPCIMDKLSPTFTSSSKIHVPELHELKAGNSDSPFVKNIPQWTSDVPRFIPKPKMRNRIPPPVPPPRRSLIFKQDSVDDQIRSDMPQFSIVLDIDIAESAKNDKTENDQTGQIKEAISQLEEDLISDEPDSGDINESDNSDYLNESDERYEMAPEPPLINAQSVSEKETFPFIVRALYNYEALEEDHLGIRVNDKIIVSGHAAVNNHCDRKWYIGEHYESGNVGMFPKDIVTITEGEIESHSTIWV